MGRVMRRPTLLLATRQPRRCETLSKFCVPPLRLRMQVPIRHHKQRFGRWGYRSTTRYILRPLVVGKLSSWYSCSDGRQKKRTIVFEEGSNLPHRLKNELASCRIVASWIVRHSRNKRWPLLNSAGTVTRQASGQPLANAEPQQFTEHGVECQHCRQFSR